MISTTVIATAFCLALNCSNNQTTTTCSYSYSQETVTYVSTEANEIEETVQAETVMVDQDDQSEGEQESEMTGETDADQSQISAEEINLIDLFNYLISIGAIQIVPTNNTSNNDAVSNEIQGECNECGEGEMDAIDVNQNQSEEFFDGEIETPEFLPDAIELK